METTQVNAEETHKYIDNYPIKPDSKHLIIGTIHAPLKNKFKIDFFYGSSSSLWRLFHDSFPDIDLDSENLNSILRFLDRNRISITDTIKVCRRKKIDSALDTDLIPIVFNKDMKEQIINSEIENLYFTSGFGKNNAFRLFYVNVLNNGYVKDWMKKQKEFKLTINEKKTVTCHILISPSEAANRSVGRNDEYKAMKHLLLESNLPPTYAYKIRQYQNVFRFLK
jgi:hypothetical protein